MAPSWLACHEQIAQQRRSRRCRATELQGAAGCCPPAAAVTCCLLSPAFVCLLSICGQCDRMPGQHTAHTHGTHAHPHTCVQLSSENGSVKCFPFPGNQSDAIQLRPQPGHAAVLCVPSRCLPNGRILPFQASTFVCTTNKKKGRGCSAQSGGGGSNGRMERRNCACSACSFVRSAKMGKIVCCFLLLLYKRQYDCEVLYKKS